MHSNDKIEFLRKCVGQQRYPIQLCVSPLDIMYTMEVQQKRFKKIQKQIIKLIRIT